MPKGRKPIDLSGQTFGSLTVSSESVLYKRDMKWRCRCNCGAEVWVTASGLRSGRTHRCVECRREEHRQTSPGKAKLEGQKFGQLTVRGLLESREGRGYWVCVCECGNERIANTSDLRKGRIYRCKKCKSLAGVEGFLEGAKKQVCLSYKRNATRRGHIFDLTFDRFCFYIVQPCFYCGETLSNCYKQRGEGREFRYNGIDRLDNTKGYEEGNVVSCCGQCNRAKGTLSKDDFIAWIKRVSNWSFNSQGVVSDNKGVIMSGNDYNAELIATMRRQIEVYEEVLKPIARAAKVTNRALIIRGSTEEGKEPRQVKGVLEWRHLQAADEALRAFGLEYPLYTKQAN